MTWSLIFAAVFIAIILWYALAGRAWLKKQPWAAGLFAAIEPIEIGLFRKSETILVGRLIWAGGVFVMIYDGIATFASSLDLTPLTTRAFEALHIPPDMRALAVTAAITLLGRLITWLRQRTTKPVELVAVSDNVVASNPFVAQTVAAADATKAEAVAVVAAEAKAA